MQLQTGSTLRPANRALQDGAHRETVAVTMNEILLRGCTLKNSGFIVGLVVYTGPESRIQMNAAEPPRKQGRQSSAPYFYRQPMQMEPTCSSAGCAVRHECMCLARHSVSSDHSVAMTPVCLT
jgi:hypothetical protein